MGSSLQELQRAVWLAIIRWTLIATIASAVISAVISEVIMRVISQGMNVAGLATAVILPIVLGGPMMFYHLLRHHQLKLANQKLQVLASTDWLTACLNRRAFTHQVTDHLGAVPEGAFLVIDAD